MCRLRTTTPLPVTYELNEPTGSPDRKSKQKERRKCVRKHTQRRDGGTLCWKTGTIFFMFELH